MTDRFEYECKEIADNLQGGTITAAIKDESAESYGFMVEKDGKKLRVWVDCDPEGNGPGHLQIEEVT